MRLAPELRPLGDAVRSRPLIGRAYLLLTVMQVQVWDSLKNMPVGLTKYRHRDVAAVIYSWRRHFGTS